MRLFVSIMVLALVACAGTASARSFTVGGVTVEFPEDGSYCPFDHTDDDTHPRFDPAAEAQSRIGNELKMMIVRCDERQIAAGPPQQWLSEWSLIFAVRRSQQVGEGVTHEAHSQSFCDAMPEVLKKQGSEIGSKVRETIKEVYQMDSSASFDTPFMYRGTCLVPGKGVFGDKTVHYFSSPVVVGNAVFYFASYTTDETQRARIVEQLVDTSEKMRQPK